MILSYSQHLPFITGAGTFLNKKSRKIIKLKNGTFGRIRKITSFITKKDRIFYEKKTESRKKSWKKLVKKKTENYELCRTDWHLHADP